MKAALQRLSRLEAMIREDKTPGIDWIVYPGPTVEPTLIGANKPMGQSLTHFERFADEAESAFRERVEAATTAPLHEPDRQTMNTAWRNQMIEAIVASGNGVAENLQQSAPAGLFATLMGISVHELRTYIEG